MQASDLENAFYGQNDNKIYKYTILENDTIEETLLINSYGYGNISSGFSVEGNKLFFILENNGMYYGYTKVGNEDAILLYEGSDCCWTPFLFNDRYIQFRWGSWTEMVQTESGAYNYSGQNYPTIDGLQIDNLDFDLGILRKLTKKH